MSGTRDLVTVLPTDRTVSSPLRGIRQVAGTLFPLVQRDGPQKVTSLPDPPYISKSNKGEGLDMASQDDKEFAPIFDATARKDTSWKGETGVWPESVTTGEAMQLTTSAPVHANGPTGIPGTIFPMQPGQFMHIVGPAHQVLVFCDVTGKLHFHNTIGELLSGPVR